MLFTHGRLKETRHGEKADGVRVRVHAFNSSKDSVSGIEHGITHIKSVRSHPNVSVSVHDFVFALL